MNNFNERVAALGTSVNRRLGVRKFTSSCEQIEPSTYRAFSESEYESQHYEYDEMEAWISGLQFALVHILKVYPLTKRDDLVK